MKYKLVIFDLDGTLLDTLEDLTDSTNHVLEAFGFEKKTILQVKSYVGNGIRKLIERSVPKGTDSETADSLFCAFNEYYKVHCSDKTQPYDGITELLETLRQNGVRTAVVSNKADYAVKELCSRYFPGLIDDAVGERAGVPKKPSPDCVNEILEKSHIDRKDAVYIGDSDVDVLTAKNAGTDCIAVDWGFRDVQVLKNAGATVIVSHPRQISDIVLS